MLVTNPRRINHEQLRILAKNAKGNIDKLYLHWTGCAYGQVFDAYHINIDEHGEIYLTCNTLCDLKEHTWKRNSRAIGITLCCAKGAVLNYHWQPVYAGYPPTELQVEQMAIVIAILCRELELEISFTTVKTHAEVALLDGYGPGQDDPEMRWDLLRLSGLPETRVLRPGGELLRKKALAYSERLLSAQLLKQPEEEQQMKLLAA
ncbi:peptidoglycan recognition protein family protein [Phascolarctobacterium succinatutens]|uniref:peptidoglycan recognition protein family protein n=1 Tax=Phascolarctobacterium succinatutens TaxID=626940 RepID=UPI00307AD1C6